MAKLKDFVPNAPKQAIPVKVKKGFEVPYAPITEKTIKASVTTIGLTVDSLEAGIDNLYQFPIQETGSRFNYAVLFEEDDGSYTAVHRVGMPCWGALREYHCGTRPDDDWPGDLRQSRHIFPKTGLPVAVSIQFHGINDRAMNNKFYASVDQWNRYITEFVFNAEISPFRSILTDYELIIRDDEIVGAIFKDTKINPNILVGLARICCFRGSSMAKDWCVFMDEHPDIDGRIAFLKGCTIDSYYMSGKVVLDRWFSGQPFDLSSGKTFYERESYNRPDIQYLFGGKANVGQSVGSMSLSKIVDVFNDWTAKQAVEVKVA